MKQILVIRKYRVATTMLLLGAAGLVLLARFDPATSGVFPPCPVHYLTGLYCPGCGSLRAIHALLHGDLRQAWAMNALTVIFLPFIGYGLMSELYKRFRGHALPEMKLPATSIRALGAAIVIFGMLRNVPVSPFNGLAPHVLLHLR